MGKKTYRGELFLPGGGGEAGNYVTMIGQFHIFKTQAAEFFRQEFGQVPLTRCGRNSVNMMIAGGLDTDIA
jgi:hypothetical protein